MKTNVKKHPVFAYLLGNIPTADRILNEYGDQVNDTIQARLEWVLKTFRSEYGYNIARMGEVAAFREWLMGLPSAIDIDYENYRIIELAKEWGSIPVNANERQEEKITANWFNFIAVKFFQLCRYNKAK